MDNQQIYITNSTVKYPFDDQHTYDIANDIVLDMSLSVPENVRPVVTVISITESVFFLAVEDALSKDALGHFILPNPKAFRSYAMEATMDGCFGWIVLGPGRNRSYENRTLELELDPTVVLYRPAPGVYIKDLEIDGITYENIPGELAFLSINPYITMSVESRTLTGLPGESGPVVKKCLVFKRDDSKFSASILYGGLTEAGASILIPATSLGGTYPDDEGNIDLVSSTFAVTTILTSGPLMEDSSSSSPGDEPIQTVNGFLFNSTADVCPPQNLLLTYVKHGRCDVGETEAVLPLPLDACIEEDKPYYADKNCGCDLSSSSSTGRSSSSSRTDISSYTSISSSSVSMESESSVSESSFTHSSASSFTHSSSSSFTHSSASSNDESSSQSGDNSSESSSQTDKSSQSSDQSSPSSQPGSGSSGIISPKNCWWGYLGIYNCDTETAEVNYSPPEQIGGITYCNEVPFVPPDQWFYLNEGPASNECTFVYVKGGPECAMFGDCPAPPSNPDWTGDQAWLQFCSCWTPKNCMYQFVTDYDCTTDTFSPVTLSSQTCIKEDCTEVDWELYDQTETTCTFIKTMCFNHTQTEGCGVDSECDAHFPGVPNPPEDLAGCDCAAKGACCTAGGGCKQTTEARCAYVLNGYYMGQGLPCEPNVCKEECTSDCVGTGAIFTSDSPEGCKNLLDCDFLCPFGSMPCDSSPIKYAWFISSQDPDNAWGCDCCCTPIHNACSELGDCSPADTGGAMYDNLADAWKFIRENCKRLCYNNLEYDQDGCPIAHDVCGGFVTESGGMYMPQCCCQNDAIDPQPPIARVVSRYGYHTGQYGDYCCLGCCNDQPCENRLDWIIDRNPLAGPSCGGTYGYFESFSCERDWGRTETCDHGCVLYYSWASWSAKTGQYYEDCIDCQAQT